MFVTIWLFGIFKIEFIVKGTCSFFIIGKVNVGLLPIALMHGISDSWELLCHTASCRRASWESLLTGQQQHKPPVLVGRICQEQGTRLWGTPGAHFCVCRTSQQAGEEISLVNLVLL